METNFIPSFTQLDTIRDIIKQRVGKDSLAVANTPEIIQEAEQYLARTQESLRSNPLLLRYIQDRDASARFRNTQPWHALAERLATQLSISVHNHPSIKPIPMPPDDNIPDVVRRAVLVHQIGMAQVYLWKESTRLIAHHSPVPRHTISRDVLPHPYMFFSWEAALPLASEENFDVDWMLISDEGPGFGVTVCPASSWDSEGEMSAHLSTVGLFRYGDIYPDNMPKHPISAHDSAGWILGYLAFINSPYVTMAKAGAPRSLRRQIGEHLHDEGEASVVTLRRSAVNMVNNKRLQGEGSEVNWQHQWWVSGHIRAQWRPSTKDHKLIWVAPYLKGPEDKPILSKVYSVSR